MRDEKHPEPGWYPDPADPGLRRYWDGSAWTDARAPLTVVGAGTPPGASGPGATVAQGPAEVVTWLWQSIVVTLLCCMPLGIPAIVFSSQAQSAINVGDIALARERAEQAKKWTLVSFWLGLIPFVAMLMLLLIPVVLVPFFTLSPLYNQ